MKTTIKTGKATGKESKKSQGSSAQANELSEFNMQRAPSPGFRGLGTEYAYAVANAIQQSKQVKGSSNGFLGQEKVSLDTKEHAHSLLKNKK